VDVGDDDEQAEHCWRNAGVQDSEAVSASSVVTLWIARAPLTEDGSSGDSRVRVDRNAVLLPLYLLLDDTCVMTFWL